MSARRLIMWTVVGGLLLLLFAWSPDANADDGVGIINPIAPGTGGLGPTTPTNPLLGGGAEGPGAFSGPNISPGALSALFLCPGVGVAVNVIGGGGGYCDYDFQPVEVRPGIFGNMHEHCEWGGFSPIANAWQCWRVFPGQPDHPRLVDPDIVPDGFGVPWAINGPTPNDQWPPLGLAPAAAFAPPPEGPPPPPPEGPPPGPPPEPPPP
jgi:hypothetical protein